MSYLSDKSKLPQRHELQRAPGVDAGQDAIAVSDAFITKLNMFGFFGIKLYPEGEGRYLRAEASFVCDTLGLVEIEDFFAKHTTEYQMFNRLTRYRDFYFKCRGEWEKKHGDETRSKGEEESSQ